MGALAWHGKKDGLWDRVSDRKAPKARDATLKVTSRAIYGSGLHLIHNYIPVLAMRFAFICAWRKRGNFLVRGTTNRRRCPAGKIFGATIAVPLGSARPTGGTRGVIGGRLVLRCE